MGTTCCCLSFLDSIEVSDWIAIVGVFVNSALAFWVVKTIQNKLTNKRVLKDHFINEVKEIRAEYETCLNNLYSNKTHPTYIIPWFKLMNIKVNDIMTFINTQYKIDTQKLNPYQIELQELITNNEDFISQFKSDKVIFSEKSKTQIIVFQQNYNQLFNDVIVKINDSD